MVQKKKKKLEFLPIGIWCYLVSKWEKFIGIIAEGSRGAKWVSFFPVLKLGVSGTNHISCSLPVQLFLRAR